MPLGEFFEEKLTEIRSFMETPGLRLLVIRHDPDLKDRLRRMLVKLEEDEKNPHLMSYVDLPFGDPARYFREVLDEQVGRNEDWRDELKQSGVDLAPPPPSPDRAEESDPDAMARRLAGYVSAVADCLPDQIGSLVLLLDPASVEDEARLAAGVKQLVAETTSDWAKFILLAAKQSRLLEGIEQASDACIAQDFYMDPEDIEERVLSDLAGDRLTPDERRQYTMMAASFAFADKRYDEAERFHLEALRLSGEAEKPVEQANCLYNLGNTYLEQGRFPEAQDRYVQSFKICLEQKCQPLLAMVLTNLGVALHREGRVDEALGSFDAAQATNKALNNPPGEAYVLDCKAKTLALEKRNGEAEEAWIAALELYRGITAPALADVRRAGLTDICDKLERFYKETRQKQKIGGLSEFREDGGDGGSS